MHKRTGDSSKSTPSFNTWVGFVPQHQKMLKDARPYLPFLCSFPHPQKFPSMYVRSSLRWFKHGDQTEREFREIPFINRVGKFTSHLLGKWKCHPQQWLASVVSSVASRLRAVFRRKHRKKIPAGLNDVIIRAAAIYSIDHDDYFLDRVVAVLKGNHKALRKLVGAFACKLGENYRFVYNQVCSQTHWLSFRSKWIRDKPKIEGRPISLLQKSSETRPPDDIISILQSTTHYWVVNHINCSDTKITLSAATQDGPESDWETSSEVSGQSEISVVRSEILFTLNERGEPDYQAWMDWE